MTQGWFLMWVPECFHSGCWSEPGFVSGGMTGYDYVTDVTQWWGQTQGRREGLQYGTDTTLAASIPMGKNPLFLLCQSHQKESPCSYQALDLFFLFLGIDNKILNSNLLDCLFTIIIL